MGRRWKIVEAPNKIRLSQGWAQLVKIVGGYVDSFFNTLTKLSKHFYI